MKHKRWVATTGYTLYDEMGREYILYTDNYDEELETVGSYRETAQGIEFLDANHEVVFVEWGELELDFD